MVRTATDDTSSMTSSQGKSFSVWRQNIEAKLNKNDLEKIMIAFMPETECKETKLELNCEEFSERLFKILRKGSKKDYVELFERIDIVKSGCVDWDKFVEFMLLEFYEEDEKVKTTKVPQWKDLKMITSPHKESVQRIMMMSNPNRYITVSREGHVIFWDLSLKMLKASRLSVEAIKQKDIWVTDCVVMENVNKLAVTFTSKELIIYDLSSKPDFSCLYRVQELQNTPNCLSYWFDEDDENHSILSMGDVSGELMAIIFYDANSMLFPSNKEHHPDEVTTYVRMKDIPRERTKRSKLRLVQHHAHDGWIRQVKYIEHLECFISCSTGRNKSIILSYIDKKKSPLRTVVLQYENGINCFDYHKQMNLIATGCINNQVCLWNPYVVGKPIGVLTGHMAPVIQVAFNPAKNQLLTFSKDKVLRTWDVQQQMCLQRIAGIFPKGPEVKTILFFDPLANRLFITFNYQLTALDMKVEVRNKVMSHERPITAVVYNHKHNQVITACQGGAVNVWMIDNGQKIKQFSDCHGSAEISCIQLDYDHSKLFTGGSDGVVKVWDFNGHCHHNLNCAQGQSADITQILILKRSVVAVGWSRALTKFKKSMKQFHVDPVDWSGGCEHVEDILCADYLPPSLLVTGSYDGEVVVWNGNTESVVRKISQRSKSFLIERDQHVRPITSQSQSSELEFSCIISRLVILKHRLSTCGSPFDGCDLVSSGGAGWCRFWSISSGRLLHEFVAHPHAGNAIVATDEENSYLVTADSDGTIKIWFMLSYLMSSDLGDKKQSNPELIRSWNAHSDAVTSLAICSKMGNLLIVSASTDCAVSLWDWTGNKIGDFGQEQHWRLDVDLETLRARMRGEDKTVVAGHDEGDTDDEAEELDKDDKEETSDEADEKAEKQSNILEDAESGRFNSWKSTLLGDVYKEGRINKRERKQPGTVPGFKRYLESTQTPYGVLSCSELGETAQVERPDFMLNPHKYFGEKFLDDGDEEDEEKLRQKTEDQLSIRDVRHTLKAAFDEKTFFPKEMLDYEAQVRNGHLQKLRVLEAKKKVSSSSSGILKSSSSIHNQSSHSSQAGAGDPHHSSKARLASITNSIAFMPGH